MLPANQKHSADPGDNKLMINARREFLQQDYYLPLAVGIANCFAANLKSSKLRLHDAGCGEGYYLNKVVAGLAQQKLEITGTGSDISKSAIGKAAKKYPRLNFAVASSFNLPMGNESAGAVLQVFAPSSSEEVLRVLEPQGFWLQVTPGPTHLAELKNSLYDNAVLHEPQTKVPAGFACLQQDSITFEFALADSKTRENLLMMTPFYWAAKASERPKIIQNMRQLTADFSLTLWQKIP